MSDKKLIRKEMSEKRLKLNRQEVLELSQRLEDIFINSSIYKNAKVIAAYHRIKNEVDLVKVINCAHQDKKEVLVPVTDNKTNEIYLAKIYQDDVFVTGDFGITVPKTKRKVSEEEVDVFLVPGLAFDKKGNRAGWGKGYYDRLLALSKGIKIGVGYGFQIYNEIESNPHDVKMDYILTEGGLMRCE